MHFHIITLFPKAFSSYLGESILKRAIEDKKIKVSFYNPRDFVKDKNKRIDRHPYAGGPGMVIQAEPVIKAIESAIKKSKLSPNTKPLTTKIIWLSPQGRQFDNTYAKKVASNYKHIIIICGRYEGIDARVKKVFKVEEVSVGPFVLTGGELPAMMMIDVISRQVSGVLGNFDSLEESRIATKDVYTRPEVFKYTPPGRGKKAKYYRVPKILLSGNTAEIEKWKRLKKRFS